MKKTILLFLFAVIAAGTGAWAQTYTDVSTFQNLKTALSAGNHVRLTSDITCTEMLTIGDGKK